MKVYEEPLSKKPEALKEINKEAAKEESSASSSEKVVVKKEKGEQEGIHAKATLFVSTIPFDATEEDLENFFSLIGPIRSCFLVKKEGKSTGCGFVQYALPDDAKKALVDLKKKKFLEKRTLKLAFAVRKGVADERKKAGIPLDAEKKEEKRKARELAQVQKKIKLIPEGPGTLPSKSVSKKIENSVSIEISGLPSGLTKQVLNKKVRKFGTVKEIDFSEGTTVAKVVYSSSQEAKDARKHLDQHTYKGVTIGCMVVETITAASIAKRGRLIIRNLAFACKKEHLLQVFEAYGKIVDCSVPSNAGKARGFGFVQFESVDDATKAIEQMNGQKILNRPVAIDWALGKSQYEILSAVEAKNATSAPDEENSDEELDATVSDDDKQSGSDGEDVSAESGDDDNAIIFSDAESEDEPEQQKSVSEPEPNSTLFVRNLSFDTTKDALKSLFRKWGELNYAVITMDKITGISRGNGFVCFKSAECASKCLDDYQRALEVAESMGFSQSAPPTNAGDYQVKSSLNPSLPETAQEATKDFMQDGRLISVTLAVSKQIAEKISQASALSRRATDKRHLYLMREGVIFPGSEASNELTPQELEHCTSQFANKKRLLATNPNLFISRTRLSIRGLPPKLSDHELRLKAKQAVKTFWEQVAEGKRETIEPEVVEEELTEGLVAPGLKRKIILKQAKIIKDADRLDPVTKKPKSKGYGFIEFGSHADALACLRVLNNQRNAFLSSEKAQQDVSSSNKSKRLALEFAVENQLVLKKRQQRNTTDPKAKTKEKGASSLRKPAVSKKRKAEDEKVASTESPAPKKLKESKFKERRMKRQAKVMEKMGGNQPPPVMKSISSTVPTKVKASRESKRKHTTGEESKLPTQKPKKKKDSSDDFDKLLSQYASKKGFQAAT